MAAANRMSTATSEYPVASCSEAIEVPNDSWSAYIFTSRNLKTVTLWGTSLLCATLAWLGGLLFLYVLLSRYFLPATAHHSRSLYFDYTKADAVATAHFLPDVQYHKASLSEVAASQARFLSPKQRFDVWLELATPEAHGQAGDEIFQVVGELLSADGRVAGSSSRPCLVRQRYWLSRTFRLWFNAPFVILGLWDERQDFQVPLFNDYREQAATPFVVFRGTLQARAGGGRLPQLYEAKVHLQLRLGLFSRLLALTRPGNWIAWSLIGLSLLCIVGGSLGCLSLLGLWFLTGPPSSSVPRRRASNYGRPDDESDLNGDLSEDESAAADEAQGAVDDVTDINSDYKDTNSGKLAGSTSQSSLRSDDSMRSGFGAQESYVSFSPQQQRQKKRA